MLRIAFTFGLAYGVGLWYWHGGGQWGPSLAGFAVGWCSLGLLASGAIADSKRKD